MATAFALLLSLFAAIAAALVAFSGIEVWIPRWPPARVIYEGGPEGGV